MFAEGDAELQILVLLQDRVCLKQERAVEQRAGGGMRGAAGSWLGPFCLSATQPAN